MPVRAFRVVLCIWIVASILTGCGRRSAAQHSALPQPAISGADVKNGKAVFARECAACHGQYGAGGPIGPALTNERSRRTYEQVRAIVANPQPPMPKLYPSRMTRPELADVAAYVESL
jgi:mono/diheme cytochrome c family protein